MGLVTTSWLPCRGEARKGTPSAPGEPQPSLHSLGHPSWVKPCRPWRLPHLAAPWLSLQALIIDATAWRKKANYRLSRLYLNMEGGSGDSSPAPAAVTQGQSWCLSTAPQLEHRWAVRGPEDLHHHRQRATPGMGQADSEDPQQPAPPTLAPPWPGLRLKSVRAA